MATDQQALLGLMRALAGDRALAAELLADAPVLATGSLERGATRSSPTEFFLDAVAHHVYAGDTALHVAAAAHRPEQCRALVAAGAEVEARNRRGAQPLHYACDSGPGRAEWDPEAQAATVAFLVEAGADPDATDASGVAPLHRAVRARSAAAVAALLNAGADRLRPNRNGSTPMLLAVRHTGRGGSGTPEAKQQQREIVRLLGTDLTDRLERRTL